ncbi:hypothetical protein [Aquipuribacter hungaricus]|uniref:Apea-like HEPN domain-containing protein n=1 Tax=Aquipuribacter hungaricus TaxID=545624 RepID=A0ABV7WDL0_9MICO
MTDETEAALGSVRSAAQVWVEAVINVLLADPSSFLIDDDVFTSWVRTDENTFAKRRATATWHPRLYDEAAALPEHDSLLQRARESAVINGQLGQLVGSPMGSARMEPERFAMALLPGPTQLDGYNFDVAWTAWVEVFTEDVVAQKTVIPLLGLDLEGATLNWDANTAVRPLTDNEVVAGLRVGVLRSAHYDSGVFTVLGSSIAGLVIEQSLPKVVGEWPADAMFQYARENESELASKVDLLRQSLALVGLGAVKLAGRYGFTEAPVLGRSVTYQAFTGPLRLGPSVPIRAAQVSQFEDTWVVLASAASDSHKSLALASRRLSFAHQRERDEDIILDLLIASEAFYLSGNSTELRFRLSLRAAYWNELPGWSRREVFDLFLKAYDVRSKVAHGGTAKANDMQVRGSVVSLHDFIEATDAVLTAALQKEVRRLHQASTPLQPVAWEDLIVGSTAAPTDLAVVEDGDTGSSGDSGTRESTA